MYLKGRLAEIDCGFPLAIPIVSSGFVSILCITFIFLAYAAAVLKYIMVYIDISLNFTTILAHQCNRLSEVVNTSTCNEKGATLGALYSG